MTVSKEAIDQYRVRIRELIYDLETTFGVPGAHQECMALASALVALDRKWQAAPAVFETDPEDVDAATGTADDLISPTFVEVAREYVRGHGSGPLPGRGVTVVRTPDKTLLVRKPEEK